MKILIGSDKMGESLKNHLKSYLICKGYQVIDKTEDGILKDEMEDIGDEMSK